MAYSSSDFTSNLINHLFDHGLITGAVVDSDDLEYQCTEAMAAISDLAQRATDVPSPSTALMNATGAAPDQPHSAQFMSELLDAHETLTDIAEQQGALTLADCMYMLSAIQKGSFIEIHYPTESNNLGIVKSLPSAALWMTYLHEVAECAA